MNIALLGFGQTAKSPYAVTETAYSKCVCTVKRYNAETWALSLINQKTGEQTLTSNIVVITILWADNKLEVGRDKFFDFSASQSIGLDNPLTVLNVKNHPEISRIEISGTGKHNYEVLYF